jgi:hypothetical protein
VATATVAGADVDALGVDLIASLTMATALLTSGMATTLSSGEMTALPVSCCHFLLRQIAD